MTGRIMGDWEAVVTAVSDGSYTPELQEAVFICGQMREARIRCHMSDMDDECVELLDSLSMTLEEEQTLSRIADKAEESLQGSYV